LEDLKEEVKSLEREKYRFSNLKKAFVSFTKKMNSVSNSGLEMNLDGTMSGTILDNSHRAIEISDESASSVQ